MAGRLVEGHSTSLIIRETQIKTTVSDHFTLVRMAIIKRVPNNKCWQGMWRKGTLIHDWWKVDWCSHYGKQCGSPSKKLRPII